VVPHREVGDHPPLTIDCSGMALLAGQKGHTGAIDGEKVPIKVWEPSMLEWIPIVIVAVDECAGCS
jgi:hypothetical protein